MAKLPDPKDHRTADYPIDPIFVERWSPRAMSGEPVSDQEIMTLFEAARWAPSTYNVQEWRFCYARREGPDWQTFFDLLVDANQAWCRNAALLGVVLSQTVFPRNGKPNPVHVFDSGLAYMSLALQGARMGLVVHGMAGFDGDRARRALQIPDDFSVNAMFAVGRPGDPGSLPETMREGEVPSGRRPAADSICEGPFSFSR